MSPCIAFALGKDEGMADLILARHPNRRMDNTRDGTVLGRCLPTRLVTQAGQLVGVNPGGNSYR
jgi:hypothetical protein